MRSLAVFVVLSCFPIVTLGGPSGIEGTNYSVTASVSDLDSGNRIAFSGQARLPVADYTGISLTASRSEFNGKNNYIDTSSRSAGIGVFLRKYDLGIINAQYGYARSEADTGLGSIKNNINSVSLSGTYYIESFDLTLGRSKGRPDTGNSINASNIGATYYISNNLMAGVSIGGMDADETENINISFQPQIFNNAIDISASYQDTKTIDSFSLSLTYYFDSTVNLIDKVRRY